LGARPQFIKAGSVSREMSKYDDIEEVIVHTGQHYDSNMSEIFFDEMKILKPKYFLGIGGKSHGAMTGQMIEKIEEVALIEKPDYMMVYGDTNSTLAGAIVASKLHIRLVHIEAGLRSFNMKMPEEVNRILTDRVSSILFCPTETAMQNLKSEGYDKLDCKVVNSGDVMQDGAIFYGDLAVKPQCEIEDDFILCTIHRAESTDNEQKLRDIFDAISVIAKDKQIILPLHPRTKIFMERYALDTKNLTLIDPVGYLEMVWLIKNCEFVMTDSGGLQKEAYFFNKQCITFRDETEWLELVDHGYNSLVGSNKKKILLAYNELKEFKCKSINLYGNGKSSELIVKVILDSDNDR